MKKLLSFLMVPMCTMVALFGIKAVEASTRVSQTAHAGTVTCYSTYKSSGSWTIYVCGQCCQEDNVYDWRDRGSCSTEY